MDPDWRCISYWNLGIYISNRYVSLLEGMKKSPLTDITGKTWPRREKNLSHEKILGGKRMPEVDARTTWSDTFRAQCVSRGRGVSRFLLGEFFWKSHIFWYPCIVSLWIGIKTYICLDPTTCVRDQILRRSELGENPLRLNSHDFPYIRVWSSSQ